jgi:HCOMODA/2-hydroxy-3-carboxy-muconic semialdehyde decarboxylase
VFRTVYTCRYAELQWRAQAIGTVGPLTAGEMDKAGLHNLRPAAIERGYDYWVARVAKAGLLPPRGRPATTAKRPSAKSRKAVANPRKRKTRRRR